jgi:L-2-hydroxyglutarate oxidase LhgO
LAVSQVILEKLIQSGGDVIFSAKIDFRDGATLLNQKPIEAGIIINSAGTGALKIAHQNNAGFQYSQLPILGTYKTTSHKNLGLRTLVYPVPNPKNPFLGVHFTVAVDGQIKIGPSAVPTLGREFYTFGGKFDLNDIASGAKSITAMTLKAFPVLSQLIVQELPKAQSRIILKEGAKLVPAAGNVKDWHKKRPGIRAQLIDLQTGRFEMDFKVEKSSHFIHILNAVSPGWTASIPFAEWIVSEYVS